MPIAPVEIEEVSPVAPSRRRSTSGGGRSTISESISISMMTSSDLNQPIREEQPPIQPITEQQHQETPPTNAQKQQQLILTQDGGKVELRLFDLMDRNPDPGRFDPEPGQDHMDHGLPPPHYPYPENQSFNQFGNRFRDNLRRFGNEVKRLPHEVYVLRRMKLGNKRYNLSEAQRERTHSTAETLEADELCCPPGELSPATKKSRGPRSRSLSLRREDFRRLSRRVRRVGTNIKDRLTNRHWTDARVITPPSENPAETGSRGRSRTRRTEESRECSESPELNRNGRRPRSISIASLRRTANNVTDHLQKDLHRLEDQIRVFSGEVYNRVRRSSSRLRQSKSASAVPYAKFDDEVISVLRIASSKKSSESVPNTASKSSEASASPTEKVPKEKATLKALGEVQLWKLTQLFHWLDIDKNQLLSEDDFDMLSEAIFRYTSWPFDSPLRKLIMERFSFFWDFLSTVARQVNESHERKSSMDLSLWLKIWEHVLSSCPVAGVLPHWVFMLPQTLFLTVDYRSDGYISKAALVAFYSRFLELPPYQADYMGELAFQRMTGNDSYCLTAPLYELLFAEFILSRSISGPGQYIFGIMKPGTEEHTSAADSMTSSKEKKKKQKETTEKTQSIV